MSQVTVQDGTTLVISPYDKTILKEIEKCNYQKQKSVLHQTRRYLHKTCISSFDEERRKEIVKDVKKTR